MRYRTEIMQFNNLLPKKLNRDQYAEIEFNSDFNGKILTITVQFNTKDEFQIMLKDQQIIELANFIKSNIESQKGILL